MSTENDETSTYDPLFDDGTSGREKTGFVPEFLRKVAVAGLGAVFMTEEGVRNLAGQLKLPKEVLGFVVSQAEKTKDDVSRVVSEELRRFLQSDKLRQELMKLVSGAAIEVTAQIRLVPGKSSSVKLEPAPEGEAEEPVLHVPEVTVTKISAKRHAKKAKKDE